MNDIYHLLWIHYQTLLRKRKLSWGLRHCHLSRYHRYSRLSVFSWSVSAKCLSEWQVEGLELYFTVSDIADYLPRPKVWSLDHRFLKQVIIYCKVIKAIKWLNSICAWWITSRFVPQNINRFQQNYFVIKRLIVFIKKIVLINCVLIEVAVCLFLISFSKEFYYFYFSRYNLKVASGFCMRFAV
jgi:hypothetical protein